MRRRKISLSVKLNFSAVLFGAVICFCCAFVGYIQFRNGIQRQYNQTAVEIATVASTYIEPSQLEAYSQAARDYVNGLMSEEERQAIISSPEYQYIHEQLIKLRRGMNANDIYIIWIDTEEALSYSGTRDGWTPLWYIFDSFSQEDLSYVLGNVSGMNPEYIQEAVDTWITGERVDCYYISHSEYGYITTALLPLLDSQGETYAMVGVEIPMSTIEESLNNYILYAATIAVWLLLLFIIIYMFYLSKNIISPINTVAHEAEDFVGEGERRISQKLARIQTHDEVQRLAESILKMEVDINEYIDNLTAITKEKERISAELDVAKNIQESMLPCIFPAFPAYRQFDIFASMTPAKQVGGDFYDFFLVGKDRLALVMADVSGKGVPAALFMVIAKTLIKNRCQQGEEPAAVLENVNSQLCENNEAGMFVTVWLGIYNIRTGQLDYVNAGHEYPAVYRIKDGTFSLIKEKPNFVVAGMEGMKYRQHSLTLEPGDKLFLYTDGVPEATNSSNELFGEERMLACLNACSGASAAEILDSMTKGVAAFVKEAEAFDDLTMLAFEVKEYVMDEDEYMAKSVMVKNELDNLSYLLSFAEDNLKEFGLDERAVNHSCVCIDELFSNISFYSGAREVEFTISRKDDSVFMVLKDDGVEFDPTAVDEADTTQSSENRKIGGLGIHIVRRLMDSVRYEYSNGRNVVTLEKRIS